MAAIPADVNTGKLTIPIATGADVDIDISAYIARVTGATNTAREVLDAKNSLGFARQIYRMDKAEAALTPGTYIKARKTAIEAAQKKAMKAYEAALTGFLEVGYPRPDAELKARYKAQAIAAIDMDLIDEQYPTDIAAMAFGSQVANERLKNTTGFKAIGAAGP